MTTALRMNEMEKMFDDHPSLSASLESVEDRPRYSPMFGLPSQHSGFKSEPEDSEGDDDLSSGEPWSPPGFPSHRRSGSGWYRHDPYGDGNRYSLKPSVSPGRSRQTSPEYEDAPEGDEDITLAANIPLPKGADSPLKGRSPSPEPEPFADADDGGSNAPGNCNYPSLSLLPYANYFVKSYGSQYELRCSIVNHSWHSTIFFERRSIL